MVAGNANGGDDKERNREVADLVLVFVEVGRPALSGSCPVTDDWNADIDPKNDQQRVMLVEDRKEQKHPREHLKRPIGDEVPLSDFPRRSGVKHSAL